MFGSGNSVHPDVAAALRECRRAFASVALFSGVVNLLMLAGPLYMLQIYDRVLEQPERADADCALDLPGRRLCLPGRARPDPLARGGAVRCGARPAPRPGGAQRGDPPVRGQPAPRRRAPAGPGPRCDPGLSDRCGPDRHCRSALGPGVPDHLFPHPPLARGGVDDRRRQPVHDDPPDRARQPRPGQGACAGRGPARDHGGGAAAQRRDHHGDGNGRCAGAALGRGQQPLYRGHRQPERRRRRLRQRLEGAAAFAAVGDPGAGRLSRDPPGADRRRHDRRLDHDGSRARSDRDRHRQLARLHRGAAKHHPAVGGAHARRAEARGHRVATAGAQSRCRVCHGGRARAAPSRWSRTCASP